MKQVYENTVTHSREWASGVPLTDEAKEAIICEILEAREIEFCLDCGHPMSEHDIFSDVFDTDPCPRRSKDPCNLKL